MSLKTFTFEIPGQFEGNFSVQMQLTCHVKCDALISTENIRCRLALMIRRLTVQLHIHRDDQTCVVVGDVHLGHKGENEEI